jgi:hypothetical protein
MVTTIDTGTSTDIDADTDTVGAQRHMPAQYAALLPNVGVELTFVVGTTKHNKRLVDGRRIRDHKEDLKFCYIVLCQTSPRSS